jgi:hypothetical protein
MGNIPFKPPNESITLSIPSINLAKPSNSSTKKLSSNIFS